MEGLTTPWCVLCKTTKGLHEHHVIPRAYGGTKGPTVTLCGTHHTLIHDVALKAKSKWSSMVPSDFSDEAKSLFLDLVGVIAKARGTFKAHGIKAEIQIKLDRDTSNVLRAVQALTGLSTQAEALRYCVEHTYKSLTPLAGNRP